MNPYTPFFAAFNAAQKRGNPLTKEDVISQFTGGRTTSLKQLDTAELNELTLSLNRISGFQARRPNTHHDPTDKQRKAIIAIAHKMGWQTPSGKADIRRINGWCVTFGKFKKPLNDHTAPELPELVTQFDKVYQSFLKGI
jgi:hypothetical protein